MWIITSFTKMLYRCPPGPRTGDRDLRASLNLKTTVVEVLYLKSKECVNVLKLYTNSSTCVHFSAAGISRLPKGPMNNLTHAPRPSPPNHHRQKPTPIENGHPGGAMTECQQKIYWGHFFHKGLLAWGTYCWHVRGRCKNSHHQKASGEGPRAQ